MSDKPHISVVIPLYQAAAIVPVLCQRLTQILARIHPSYEIILIDDASSDGSWEALCTIAATDKKIKGARLSRNFGQHYAISAGLEFAQGDWIVVMDCDLQDAPEDIPALYAKAKSGVDIVYARQKKDHDVLWKGLGSRLYHGLIRKFTHVEEESGRSSFTLLSRKVVDAFLQVKDTHRHYLIILRWLGFRHGYVDVERHARYSGRTSYSPTKLVRLAVDGIIAQSDILLKASIYVGLISSALSMIYILKVAYGKYVHPDVPLGWSSLMATLLLMGGLILMSLGVLGIYIDRIFLQTKQRPLYIIESRVNE